MSMKPHQFLHFKWLLCRSIKRSLERLNCDISAEYNGEHAASPKKATIQPAITLLTDMIVSPNVQNVYQTRSMDGTTWAMFAKDEVMHSQTRLAIIRQPRISYVVNSCDNTACCMLIKAWDQPPSARRGNLRRALSTDSIYTCLALNAVSKVYDCNPDLT